MSDVLVETRGAVRWISLNRPDVKNALTLDVLSALSAAMDEASADKAARAVVLTGRGGSFSSGLDLKSLMADPTVIASSPDAAMKRFHDLIRAIRACPKPVVGLIDGPAVGFGCDMALSCDLRVATRRAYFQEKFVRIGLVPDGGGTFWLPRLVGLAKAAELMMLGEKLEAPEALALGVVNRVAELDQAEQVATELADRLAKGPPLALALMKAALTQNLSNDLARALDVERAAQMKCLASSDFREGVGAFLSKREPQFRGED